MPWSPIQMITSLTDPLYWGMDIPCTDENKAWSVDAFLSEVIYKRVSEYQWQATHLLLRRSRAVWKLRGKTSDLLLCSWRLRAHLGFAGVTCPGSSWSLTLAGSGVTWKSDRSQEHWHLLVRRSHPASLPCDGRWKNLNVSLGRNHWILIPVIETAWFPTLK